MGIERDKLPRRTDPVFKKLFLHLDLEAPCSFDHDLEHKAKDDF